MQGFMDLPHEENILSQGEIKEYESKLIKITKK